MRIKFYIYSVLISFTASSCSSQQTFTTPEMLGETIFNAIKNNDVVTLRKHVINKKDLAYVKSLRPEDAEVDKVILYKIDGWKKFDQWVIDQIRLTGTNAGIQWDNAKFDHVEYEIIDREEPHKSDIYVFFTSGNNNHQIKLDDCLKMPRGWVLFDDVRFDH